ncbi:hypothetical protein APASM_3007 [Actinosynnema pretiosum subsp. pretiosum]|nr:hypothetical protein APASM_3007 [Actinosynnema pretiosum subsp. pretiosum]
MVVNGRRWRAEDPGLPEEVAGRLRRALMAARREVGRRCGRGRGA